MSQMSVVVPAGNRCAAPLEWLAVARWRAALGRLNRLAVLTAVGVVVGVVLGGAAAWFVVNRVQALVVEQASATAEAEVMLGIARQLTAADFNSTASIASDGDLRSRLAPVLREVRNNDPDVIGVQLVARDGTLVYADASADLGSSLPAPERPLLLAALAGQQAWLASSPVDANLQSLYPHVLFVAVPVEDDGSIVGAYIVQHDLHALDSLGLLVWAAIAVGFGLIFHVVVRATSCTRDQPSASQAAPQVVPRQEPPTCTVRVDPHLTRREREVLQLLATPMTYQEIAGELSVSEETVRTHVKGVFNKLGQPSRTQAVLVALKTGLLEPT